MTSPVGSADVPLAYRPILDVARGVTAGYQAVVRRRLHAVDPERVAATALAAAASLPVNTFITVPVPLASLPSRAMRDVLAAHGDLAGVVLDVEDATGVAGPGVDAAVRACRAAGARIAVGGHDAPQPELRSIVRLRPDIIRLGQPWVAGIDRSAAKRHAIEVTGTLASQLDAWVLAEAVSSAAQLRVLAGLGVPLAQGPFIGEARHVWPEVAPSVLRALPPATTATDGVLRALVQQAYTTADITTAADVLPETTGYDLVVVLDESGHPVSLLQRAGDGTWDTAEALVVNIDTPVPDAVARAMARPRPHRFSPLVCTDAAGRFAGVLALERLVAHLAAHPPP